jgi:uncharacterized membrane protein
MSRGPVQYFVFSFPGNQFKGEIVPALAQVVAEGTIRIVDIVFVKKEADGTTLSLEINDLDDEEFNAFAEIVEVAEGLLSDDDIVELVAEMPPDNSAVLLVLEHAWATQLAEAIRNANGQVVTQGFVPHEIVEAVLQSRIDAV